MVGRASGVTVGVETTTTGVGATTVVLIVPEVSSCHMHAGHERHQGKHGSYDQHRLLRFGQGSHGYNSTLLRRVPFSASEGAGGVTWALVGKWTSDSGQTGDGFRLSPE